MIRFENISLKYNNNYVIENLNLTIDDNDFLVIVGPSGCGKTSLVKMLAGLIKPTSGNIYINDLLVNDIEPYKRDIAFMQQNSKSYPHMNVFDNIAFGLEAIKMDKNTIKNKVEEIAEMLSIKPYLDRLPNKLSGGEQQRLNLARALVLDKKIVILDEPLSNIDAKLKTDMRFDIKRLHEYKKCTTIYITHDQEEAMSLATKIVLMKDGKIVQVGSPKEIYDNPINMFSANFIGKMNFIKKDNYYLGFRPSDVSLNGDILVKIIGEELYGKNKNVFALMDNERIEFLVDANTSLEKEEKIKINKEYIFDFDTKMRKE